MDTYVSRERFDELLTRLRQMYRVVVPVQRGVDIEFVEYDGHEEPAFTGRTRFSIKEFLYPAQEAVAVFDLRHRDAGALVTNTEVEAPPTFLWGVRPCDLAGLELLDTVFLAQPADERYRARRASSVVACLNCNDPGASCFCASLASGPHAVRGFDLSFTDLGDGLLISAGSAKGEEVQEIVSGVTEEAKPDMRARALKLRDAAQDAQARAVDPKLLQDRLPDLWSSGLWKEVASTCTICGTCSIVCPMCHCSNLEDVTRRRGIVERTVYWDNCQYEGFTRMASHNSRPEQWQRWRHKVYDKFLYKPERLGLVGCSGCGRCIDYCQGGIDLLGAVERVLNG